MIKIGIIGYGFSAQTFHLPFIDSSESFELTAISSTKKEIVASKYPTAAIFDTATDLIHQADVDCIVITAPNDVHFPLAEACLLKGIHVILEKPMVTTSEEAIQLIELANEKSLTLSVFQNRRWDGDFLTVKKLIQDNTLGDIRIFESHFDRFRPTARPRWREQAGKGTGIWFDLGSHLVDQTIHLFGLPHAVTGRCLITRENSTATDYAHVQLHYEKLEVILHASLFSAGPNKRFLVEGTKGSYVKYGLDPQEDQLKKGIQPSHPTFGIEAQESFGQWYTDNSTAPIATETGCYQDYYRAVANTISDNGQNPVSNTDSINVIKILELAIKSSEEKCTKEFIS